jgi:Secretion system C-terminal sorting domain
MEVSPNTSLLGVHMIDSVHAWAVGYNGVVYIRSARLNTALKEKPSLANEFSLYPNPTNGKISIQNLSNQPLTISIFNLNGSRLFDMPYKSQTKLDLDLSHLPKGVYLIKIRSKFEVRCKRLIIQ